MSRFTSCILKVTSFCNLNCTYCYMFNLEDKSYKGMPNHFSKELVDILLQRIYFYMQEVKLSVFTLIIHGGEPMLWHKDLFRYLFEAIKNNNSEEYRIEVTMQTNAYKIDWEVMELFKTYNCEIGISLDGPQIQHDKFRITHGGKPSYNRIISNIEKCIEKGYLEVIGGFLTVADPAIPPPVYYDWIQSLPLKNVSVLWPIEYNHTHKPWDKWGIDEKDYKESPVYGSWFYELFELWWKKDDPGIKIRHFADTLMVLLGSRKHGDSLVNDELNMFVVNTNGDYEYHDYFRAYKNNSCFTGKSINTDSLFDLEANVTFAKLSDLKNHLPGKCTNCANRHICGGGFLAGRMESDISDFGRLHSILCHDHMFYFKNVKELITPVLEMYEQDEGNKLQPNPKWRTVQVNSSDNAIPVFQ